MLAQILTILGMNQVLFFAFHIRKYKGNTDKQNVNESLLLSNFGAKRFSPFSFLSNNIIQIDAKSNDNGFQLPNISYRGSVLS